MLARIYKQLKSAFEIGTILFGESKAKFGKSEEE